MNMIRKVTGPEAVELLDQAARKMEPRLARTFRDGMERLRDRINADEVARLIEQRRIDEILRLLDFRATQEAMEDFRATVSAAVLAGALVAAAAQPPVSGVGGEEVRFVFNATNPRVARYAEQISSTRIREVSNNVRDVTRGIVRAGIVAGDNPRTTAIQVRENIGLTARQERAVANYRRALENLDSDALERELRDRRSDRSVLRAIEQGKPLSQEQIDSLTRRYRDRYIKYRSEVIARTESIRSVNGAQHELFQSYIDEGRIREEQVRRFWHHTFDERTRPDHRLIAGMNKNGVGQNEAFKTPLGPLMFPGDPNGLAANTIQCRCAVFSRIISMELLEDPDFNVAERFAQEVA